MAHLHLCRYEEYEKGKPLKILLVGYNGARNTGADARVVALTQQLEKVLGTKGTELTVMALDADNLNGYFSEYVRLVSFYHFFYLLAAKGMLTPPCGHSL